MRALAALALAVLPFGGCGDGYNQGRIGPDTSNPDDTGDTDADTDTDTDTDTDSDTDTDTGPSESGCHPWQPLEIDGWTKTFDLTYDGTTGTETHTAMGRGTTSTGQEAWEIAVDVSAGNASGNGVRFEDCDLDGQEGVFLLESVTHDVVDLMGMGFEMEVTLLTTEKPPRRFLPGAATLGKEGSWSYENSADVYIVQMETTYQMPTEGTYVELSTKTTSTPAGDFETYRVSHTWTQDRSSYSQWLGGPEELNVYAELRYARGIGLVYEKATDTDSGTTLYEKTLRSYSGLTPE